MIRVESPPFSRPNLSSQNNKPELIRNTSYTTWTYGD